MSLRPCRRATFDVPGCDAAAVILDERAESCRRDLVRIGWTVIQYSEHAAHTGAPRLAYACPTHHGWRPSGGTSLDVVDFPEQEARQQTLRRSAMVWMLRCLDVRHAVIARALEISSGRASHVGVAYGELLERRMASARDWQEPWARRLRAAGAIP